MAVHMAWQTLAPLSTARSERPAWADWARRLGDDVWNVPRYCLKYALLLLALLGAIQLWQAGGDGPLASFRRLSPQSPLDPQRVSAPHCMFAKTDAGQRRAALEPALAILDEVHPDVADWVRHADRSGQLTFTDSWKLPGDGSSCLARFDTFRGVLTIGPGLFAESDGRIATVLCHEYRHSRQRFSKTVVYALSFLWQRGGDPAIVENDALLFEHDAHVAVFGSYLDS